MLERNFFEEAFFLKEHNSFDKYSQFREMSVVIFSVLR